MEKICGGVTNIDNLWMGRWSDYYLRHIFNTSPNINKIENIDSALTFSWVNREIKVGETKKYSVIIEIGEDKTEEIPKENETDNKIEDNTIAEDVKDITNENTDINVPNEKEDNNDIEDKISNEEVNNNDIDDKAPIHNTLQNKNTQNKEIDNTVAKGKIPKTGENDFILPLIGILLVRTIIVYAKIKRINKQEKRINSKNQNSD